VSVLVLALAAALALGGVGSATASGITKSTVKKLAGKVVDKKAKSLSVAHAATADSATTAGSATSATTAGDSAQLGGQAPATYLDRSAHAYLTVSTAVDGDAVNPDAIQIMNPQAIVVPPGVGFLHITATASFVGGSTNVRVWPSVDSTCVEGGEGYSHSGVGNTTQQVTVPVDYLADVNPGNHNVRLCVAAGADTFTSLRSMTITTVAGDFNG
jgi:hypothetical protein